ncbi:glycosyltransferase family 20 protein [Botryobasidium botryosum FD-172 SS1]|uniref:Glycosyltransferase family 20 protein n=1 Tax=Botryobasidium botryosum (strain FD-172 SS1) TaxID=930990 RepID=A0A067MZG3_BOTB1|nr:glycosyltransferase family 20 protein [Botryobasidium botryosum FD-172 SS1]
MSESEVIKEPAGAGSAGARSDSTIAASMATVSAHRVLVVSFFLPHTVSFQDSPEATPVATAKPTPAVSAARLPPVSDALAPKPKRRPGKLEGPIQSIVDDLALRSKLNSPIQTPVKEVANPFLSFASLTSIASMLSLSSSTPAQPSRAAPSKAPRTEKPFKPESAPTAPQPPQRSGSRRLSRSSVSRSSTLRRRPSGTFSGSLPSAFANWSIEPANRGNPGLHNALNAVGDRFNRRLWIGVVDAATDSIATDVKGDIERKLWDDHESLPVWVTDSEFSQCYDVFCHQVLWPSLHYAIPDAPKTKVFYESSAFAQYLAVNQKFADAVVSVYKEGDIVWVNDYHLLLVPELVRKQIPTAIIGFFLHVTFPSSEIFRCIAVRNQLLHGMLGADLIGFQTHNNARHFRQTVSRILSLEALPKGIQLERSFVDVAVFPIGIDVAALNQKRKEPEVEEWVNLLRQRYSGMKMIVGRDKLDEVQGVRQKLLAFETFLEKYPEYQGKAVLIQVALTTTETNEAQVAVSKVVSRINSRFSTLTYQPIVFLHTSDLTFSQYLALLTVADAFLVTSLREGMALRTHEFVECQEGRSRPLILSEFTGSYSYSGFRSCLAINPWDSKRTAEAIHHALTIDDDEALSRWKDLHEHVNTQTAQAFVTSFLTRCLRAHLEHQERQPETIPILDIPAILPKYRAANRRLLLIDLEGTLWSEDPKIVNDAGFAPPTEAVDLLKRLSNNPANSVWALSGLPVEGVLDKLAAAVPNVGFVAENGCFIKPPAVDGKPQDWVSMVANASLLWKTPCLEILSYFTERTPGSFVENRGASICWRFASAEADEGARQWARRQAAEAQNHIWDSLGERYGLRIIPGATSFLVLPKNVSRSAAIGSILPTRVTQHLPLPTTKGTDFNFILAVSGDNRLIRRINDLPHSETCSTNLKNSDATWRLIDEGARKTSEVLSSLENM